MTWKRVIVHLGICVACFGVAAVTGDPKALWGLLVIIVIEAI